MTELELFQIYHLKEMSLSAELFLSCSVLQLTFYAISTAYNRKAGFVILNKQIYYIGTLLIILSSLLILNEDLLITNSLTSNNFIVNDYFSFATKFVVCLTSIFFLLIVNISFRDEPAQNNFEYVVLVTISILGLLLLCSSNDLITAYLSIELQSVAFYIMSAFKRNSSYSVESGLKYFIIGSLSSAFFLFGSALVYGCLGSLSFDDLQLFCSLFFSSPTSEYINMLSSSSLLLNTDTLFNEFTAFCSYGLASVTLTQNFNDAVSPILSSDSLIDWYTLSFGSSNILLSERLLELHSVSVTEGSAFNALNDYLASTTTFSPLFSEVDTNIGLICQSSNVSNSLAFHIDNPLVNEIFTSYLGQETSEFVKVSALNLDLISIGFILICISLFIKLSIAPFHFWSLDVYEGSPNVTTFFFSVVPKIGLFVLLTRICYVSFYPIFVTNYQVYFFLFAVLSVFVGSFGGLEQRKLKTLLAYSSVSHTGYLLLSFSTGNAEGMQMMFYYLVIYMISGLCFWSIYLFLRQKRSSYFNKSNKELGDLALLKESNPMLALILAITLFSIAGIPPVVGFLAKLGIFLVVVKSSSYLVAVLSILFSVVSTFYYIRLIKILYFENTLVGKLYMPIDTQKSLIISLLSLSLIILCIDPTIIYLLFYKATLLMS